MGCTPSIHVSQAGVIFCRRDRTTNDDQPSAYTSSSTANHQASTSLLPQKEAPRSSGQSIAVNMQHGRCWPGSSHSSREKGATPPYALDPWHQEDDASVRLGPMRLARKQIKTLLVFHREDAVSTAWISACKKRNHEIVLCRRQSDVLEAFGNVSYDLVVIDGRYPRHLSPHDVAVVLREADGAQFTVLIAVVKKNFIEKENQTAVAYLRSGINRVLVESTAPVAVLSDLFQLERNDLLAQVNRRAMQAVFAVLESCKDVVHITDPHHKIQYVNRAAEAALGYTLCDVVGRSLWEVHGAEAHKQELRAIEARQTPAVDSRQSVAEIKTTPTDNKPLNLDISEAINMQMRRGKDWDGILTCRRKSGDLIYMPSKVTPVALYPGTNDYFVYISDARPVEYGAFDLHHLRGSIKSTRKGSYDIRSIHSDGSLEGSQIGKVLSAPIERQRFTFSRTNLDGIVVSEGTQHVTRRQSLMKLNSVTIEAPITKVINIITSAQETSPAYVSQALDGVLEILRSTELYSPLLISSVDKNNVAVDPVATDLLGALLSQGPKPLSLRRSSNEQQVKVSQNPRPSLPALQQNASSCIKELLGSDLDWSFDIIKLEKLTDSKPLVWLGMSILCQFDVPNLLKTDEQTLQNWLTLIEANYHRENTYHNSTHAADVLQTAAYFLKLDRLQQIMDPLDEVTCLLAAIVHDVDHPGKNSAFLCNTSNELAILYNDLSVLESHHAAVCFKLTQSDDRVNILKGLDNDVYKTVRKSMIDMVLATDMTKHFEHLSKFVNMLGKFAYKDEDGSSDEISIEHPDMAMFDNPDSLAIIKRILIKCADINNPLRPHDLCVEWARRIANEYFCQTEEEKKRKIPVVMPQFDRATCSIPKCQIGFIDFFITGLFEPWDVLVDIPELMEHVRANYQYWKDEDEKSRNSVCSGP